jgi:hypothetical protein
VPLAANINVVVVQQEGRLWEGGSGRLQQSLLLLAASTSSTFGDNKNERNNNRNLHWWMLPFHRALMPCLNSLLYLTASSMACLTLLGHAIAKLGTQSVPMVN